MQEARAVGAAAALRGHDPRHGDQVRGGVAREVPLSTIVPGDVVHLGAGDMVPGNVLSRIQGSLHQPVELDRRVIARREE